MTSSTLVLELWTPNENCKEKTSEYVGLLTDGKDPSGVHISSSASVDVTHVDRKQSSCTSVDNDSDANNDCYEKPTLFATQEKGKYIGDNYLSLVGDGENTNDDGYEQPIETQQNRKDVGNTNYLSLVGDGEITNYEDGYERSTWADHNEDIVVKYSKLLRD